ncbi:MAG: hypothetical protein ABIF08_01775 [Nanoarchaeota archaeon]
MKAQTPEEEFNQYESIVDEIRKRYGAISKSKYESVVNLLLGGMHAGLEFIDDLPSMYDDNRNMLEIYITLLKQHEEFRKAELHSEQGSIQLPRTRDNGINAARRYVLEANKALNLVEGLDL